jgi:hypothetical protein
VAFAAGAAKIRDCRSFLGTAKAAGERLCTEATAIFNILKPAFHRILATAYPANAAIS